MRDLRYSLRLLRKNPGFTAAALLTLALGIGPSTAIFSAIDAVLLRPLPVRDPDRLVTLYSYDPHARGYPYSYTSYPDYLDYRDRTGFFSGLACALNVSFNLRVGTEAERLDGALVTPDYFDVLGVQAALGRTFRPDERAPVLVLGHDFWRRRFAGDPGVIGKTWYVNGAPVTVIGVAPPRLRGLRLHENPQFWAPLDLYRQTLAVLPPDTLARREMRLFSVVGRLRPGIAFGQAAAGLKTLASNLERDYPASHRSWTVALIPSNDDRFALIWKTRIHSFLWLAASAVGLLLVIACANAANLQLLKAAGRQKEMVVRLALGAGRGQLVRQLLTESVLLSLLGGAAGIVIAIWTNDLLEAFRQPFLRIDWESRLDFRVLGFMLLLAVSSGILFGLVPALESSRADLASALKTRLGGAGRRAGILNVLVAAQITLCFVLLAGAGLFLRSVGKLYWADPGFRAKELLLATVDPGGQGYTQERAAAFWRDLLDRVKTVPGVRSAAIARTPPLSVVKTVAAAWVNGREIPGLQPYNSVSPGYFETMGIPILAGRAFTEPDPADVAVINEALARRYFSGENPLGRKIAMHGRQLDIVGVARDSKSESLWQPAVPYLYVPNRDPRPARPRCTSLRWAIRPRWRARFGARSRPSTKTCPSTASSRWRSR